MSVVNESDDSTDADGGDGDRRPPSAPVTLNCLAGRECVLQCVSRRARPAAALQWYISGMPVSMLSHVPDPPSSPDSSTAPLGADSDAALLSAAGGGPGLWHLLAPASSPQETNPSNRTQPNGAYRYWNKLCIDWVWYTLIVHVSKFIKTINTRMIVSSCNGLMRELFSVFVHTHREYRSTWLLA